MHTKSVQKLTVGHPSKGFSVKSQHAMVKPQNVKSSIQMKNFLDEMKLSRYYDENNIF